MINLDVFLSDSLPCIIKQINKIAFSHCLSTVITASKSTSSRRMENSDLVIRRVDNIIKSQEDKRLYRGIELSNHMKILLVSDSTTDKSAAALDVNVGEYLST